MNPDLSNLIELEKLDREIARLNAEVAELPRRVAAIEQKLSAVRAAVVSAKEAIKGGEAERRRLEGEIQSQQQKISKYREQSLSVKTNEQYKALMHEIEFAEKQIRACEDNILETMVAAEDLGANLKQNEQEAERQSKEVAREQEEARQRTAEDQRLLAELNASRRQLRSAITEPSLALYDRVLKGRGTPLAEAKEQKCTACFVLLRPQKYNEILSQQDVLTCDSCGRILFYNPAAEPVPSGSRRDLKAAEDAVSAGMKASPGSGASSE